MDTQAIVLAIFASSGFWSLVMTLVLKAIDLKSAKTKLLLFLAATELERRAAILLAQEYITTDEYEEYMKYYDPYEKAGGNGTVKKLTEEIDKKPIRKVAVK